MSDDFGKESNKTLHIKLAESFHAADQNSEAGEGDQGRALEGGWGGELELDGGKEIWKLVVVLLALEIDLSSTPMVPMAFAAAWWVW